MKPIQKMFFMVSTLWLMAWSSAGNPEIDQFMWGLPAWEELSPLGEENNGLPISDVSAPEDAFVDNQLYSCTSQTYSLTKNPTELVMADSNAGIIWPGALIHGSSHLGGSGIRLLALEQSRRAPLGIAVTGGGVLGIRGGVSTEIQQPVNRTVREGINQLVANAIESDIVIGNGYSAFNSEESFGAEQATLALGFSARYLGSEVEGKLDYSRQANEYTYTATFIQRLFTIAVDQPERPSSFFTDNLSVQDLQSLGVSRSNLPLYISSVSYGRILMFSFTSSESKEQIEAALEYSYGAPGVSIDAEAEASYKKTLSDANIEVLAIGGPNAGVKQLIKEGNLKAYFDAPLEINQVEAISFNIRNLTNNSLARVSNTTEYEVEICSAVAGGNLPRPVHHWTGDGTLADQRGKVDLDGVEIQEITGAGRFGQGFVFDGKYENANTWPTTELIPRGSLFSISAWINPRWTPDNDSIDPCTLTGLAITCVETIISQVGADLIAGDYVFRVNDLRLQFFIRPNSGDRAVSLIESAQGSITYGEWTHVVVVYGVADNEPTSMRLYINGRLAAEQVRLSSYGVRGEAMQLTRIGSSQLIAPCDGRCRSAYAFDGTIDELMVFDYPLSAQDVLNMYQNFSVYKQ